MQLCPNPASVEVRLDLVSGQNWPWELFDLNGAAEVRSSISSQPTTISILLHSFRARTHLLKLTGKGHGRVEKLIKI
ncbi:putative secreted protein (Por secretion system target) [Dyadobacter jejuensis]|uniref:Putative secreted protein (Por secretion system target) n=1 Tax=Dyadobacter jejuensis TaxID=1082580 RepID=A0A316AJ93_9BACT|nr:putative secreted protein (Por secretion system target) [Dyadobacter jejuensis]